MFCPSCGAETPLGARFCSRCAMQLPVTTAPQDPEAATKIMPPPPTNPSLPSPYTPPASGAPNAVPDYQQNYGNYPAANPATYPYPPANANPNVNNVMNSVGASGKASSKAITAGILGIAAFVPGLCLGLIGVGLGGAAVFLGRAELEAIKQGRADKAGEIWAQIGFYGGIAGGVLALIVGVALCGVLLLK